jgi:hypothetical protein
MRRIPICPPHGSPPWRFWASIALQPFVPLLAFLALPALGMVPGLGDVLWLPLALLAYVCLAAAIAMSLWSVVRSMREARRSASGWALLLPLPALAMATVAAAILREAWLWIASS